MVGIGIMMTTTTTIGNEEDIDTQERMPACGDLIKVLSATI